MTKPKEMVNIFIWMEQNIRENGLMINNKEKDMKHGQMVQFMMVIILKDKNMLSHSKSRFTVLI